MTTDELYIVQQAASHLAAELDLPGLYARVLDEQPEGATSHVGPRIIAYGEHGDRAPTLDEITAIIVRETSRRWSTTPDPDLGTFAGIDNPVNFAGTIVECSVEGDKQFRVAVSFTAVPQGIAVALDVVVGFPNSSSNAGD